MTEDEDDRFNVQSAATPAQYDDRASQISGLTSSSRHLKRAIRITRQIQLADGSTQTRTEVVHDPVVISQYMKRRTEADLELREYVKGFLRHEHLFKQGPPVWRRLPAHVQDLHRWSTLKKHFTRNPSTPSLHGPGITGSQRDFAGLEFKAPTYTFFTTVSTAPGLRAMPTMIVLRTLGMWMLFTSELPALITYCRIKKELERLEKNKARRQAREQQKELHQKASAGDAGSPGAGDKVLTGTTRKCANCGQVGHIKTNKKYDSPCLSSPLLLF